MDRIRIAFGYLREIPYWISPHQDIPMSMRLKYVRSHIADALWVLGIVRRLETLFWLRGH
jgi:hypothetical protein